MGTVSRSILSASFHENLPATAAAGARAVWRRDRHERQCPTNWLHSSRTQQALRTLPISKADGWTELPKAVAETRSCDTEKAGFDSGATHRRALHPCYFRVGWLTLCCCAPGGP